MNNRDEIVTIAVLIALIAGAGVFTSVKEPASTPERNEAAGEILEDEVYVSFFLNENQVIETNDGRTFKRGSHLIAKKGEKISGVIKSDGCAPEAIEIDVGTNSEKVYTYESSYGAGKICPEENTINDDLLKTGVYLAKTEDATEDILNAALAEGELVILDVKNSVEEKAPSEDDLKDLPLSGTLNEISEDED